MPSIIGRAVAIACKPFARVRMWFRRWTSTSGKPGNSKGSTSGVYNWVNQFVGQGRHWVEWIDGRRFHCAVQRCITGQILLTVDYFAGSICSSMTLDWCELKAAQPKSYDDVEEYFCDKYAEMIDECVYLHGVQIDDLCDKLFG